MKVLVTGGAGFIGSHLVDELVALGHSVVIVDDLSTGVPENANPGAAFYRVDIRDAEALGEVFGRERPETVSHHAAQVDVTRSVIDPAGDAEINIVGAINVLVGARRYGVRRFVYASTAAVYGNPEYLPIDEQHPVRPLAAYGLSKYTFEGYLGVEAQAAGLDLVVLRYANVFGPRQIPHGEGGVVAVFATKMLAGETCRIFGDGSKTRDYTFVKDVVQANILAITRSACGVFNVGTGRETTDYEIFDAVRAAVGSSQEPTYVEKRPGEIERSCFDITRARKTLGWMPTYSLKQGVEAAVRFYQSSKETKS